MNWLSPKSIGKKLDMSPKSILRMLKRGELPCVTFRSGRKRVSEEALERFMRKLEKTPSTRTEYESGNGDSPTRSSAVQSGNDVPNCA